MKLQNWMFRSWKGQGVIEYIPTLTAIGTFSIVILAAVGSSLSARFSEVTRCVENPSGELAMVIVEPEEGNAQHQMIEYPVECNEYVVEEGESTLVVRLGTGSYLQATLSGQLEGVFDAWCVDYDHGITPGKTYTAPYNGDNTQSVERPENLPLLRWIINYNWEANGYSVMDVQGAIWLLIDDATIRRSHIGPRAEELALLAITMAGDENTDPTIKIRN